MTSVQIVTYSSEHFGGVESLWREVFPDDPPMERSRSCHPREVGCATRPVPRCSGWSQLAPSCPDMTDIEVGFMR